jgi:hypothetical protein
MVAAGRPRIATLRLALRDVIVAAFLGFPVALIASWFVE